MFDSLADQIRKDEAESTTTKERIMKMVGVLALSVVLFGGLYIGVQMLEG